MREHGHVLIATSRAAVPLNHENFYVVAATVIPVLFLAVIYQANVMDAYRRISAVYMLSAGWILLAFTVWGEIGALHVLSSGHASTNSRSFTVGGLLFLGITLTGAQLTEIARELAKAHPNRLGQFTLALVSIVVVIVVGSLRAAGVF
jgi:hypothetical protein